MEYPAVAANEAKRQMMRMGKQACPVSGWVGPLVRHHIHGRDIPNAEAAWNIVWVSPNVHQAIHCGEIIIEKWAMTTTGRQLLWHRTGDPSITGDDATPPLYSD